MIWVDNARVIATIAVIFLHTSMYLVARSEIGSYSWWIGNIYDSSVRWCIPIFVMVSGSLLLHPEKYMDLITFYKRRASKILVPFLFWTVFYSVWVLAKGVIKHEHVTLLSLGEGILLGIPYPHMWFLYMLMGLYLFAPFLGRIVSALSLKVVLFICILMFVAASTSSAIVRLSFPESRLFFNLFPLYMPYFVAGYLISTIKVNTHGRFHFILVALSSAATAIGCFVLSTRYGLQKGICFYDFLSITVIPASLSMFYIFIGLNRNICPVNVKKIAELTLGIYLIHPIFLDVLQYFGFSGGKFEPIISVPVITMLVFLLSVIAARIIALTPYLKRII
jgi:surface polysaccharide O-acyltransferase-like enzyme